MRRVAIVLALLLFACVLAPASARPAAPPLVPGVDYVTIADGKPWEPLAGKVEVVEVFAYWCPHCAEFKPLLDAWIARKPANVRVSYLPAAFNLQDPAGRAYFAGVRAGVIPKAHDALFRAIHADETMPHNATIEEYAAFLAPFGAKADALEASMHSAAVSADMARAREFEMRAGVEGTPTLIVNGTYLVLGEDHADQLRILGQLVAQLSAPKPRH